MADQIVVMKDGRVSQQGSPLQLYDFPDNTFVAGFIGSPAMNLLPGTVSATGDSVDFAGGQVHILPRAGVVAGQKVIVGMRPEHLTITSQGFAAQVVVVEPTGSETHVVFRVDSAEMTAVFRERHAFKPGESVQLTVDPQDVHLFDAETTLRLA